MLLLLLYSVGIEGGVEVHYNRLVPRDLHSSNEGTQISHHRHDSTLKSLKQMTEYFLHDRSRQFSAKESHL